MYFHVTHWCRGGLGACIAQSSLNVEISSVVIDHLGEIRRPHTALLVMDD